MPSMFRPTANSIRAETFLLSVVAALLAAWGAADPPALIGTWVLNNDLTSEVQPNGKQTRRFEGLSGVHPTITVGGIPLPSTGTEQPEYSTGPTKDPEVLACTELSIETMGDDVLLTYHGVGSETLTPGNVQGTRTKLTKRKLTSRYETTTRKVSKTFELRDDGRLLVTVSLNPNQGPTIVHKRVFDRKT